MRYHPSNMSSGDSEKSGTSSVELASESRGFYSDRIAYVFPKDAKPGSRSVQRINLSDPKIANHRFVTTVLFTLKNIFLPHDYPDSVSQDYLSYQIFDTIQAFCSSLTGALATEAVMKGVGVGDDTATALAAALTWLLKSGTGMIGQIAFTWAQGTKLDSDCKKWRFFADITNDAATFIDLLTPMIPPTFRVGVFCVSSIMRSLVGVAGGATRAAITQHQARKNNSADVSAKDGSQETLVNLVALVTSLVMLPLVSGKIALVWILYLTFTILHLIANYFALKSLQFEALNDARLLHCLQKFLKESSVYPIQDVNQLESVLVGRGISDIDVTGGSYEVSLGASISESLEVMKEGMSCPYQRDLQTVISESKGANFLILVDASIKRIHIVLHEDVLPWELVEAYSRAVFLTHLLNEGDVHAMGGKCSQKWIAFEKCLKSSKYAIDRCLLQTRDWRAKWNVDFAATKSK